MRKYVLTLFAHYVFSSVFMYKFCLWIFLVWLRLYMWSVLAAIDRKSSHLSRPGPTGISVSWLQRRPEKKKKRSSPFRYKYIINVSGGGTVGAVGAVAPTKNRSWGRRPHDKISWNTQNQAETIVYIFTNGNHHIPLVYLQKFTLKMQQMTFQRVQI